MKIHVFCVQYADEIDKKCDMLKMFKKEEENAAKCYYKKRKTIKGPGGKKDAEND